jgi:hypothetical protein
LVVLGYLAAGVVALCLLLVAALIAGAVAVGVAARGLARPLAVGVAGRFSSSVAGADGRAASRDSVPSKSAPRLVG